MLALGYQCFHVVGSGRIIAAVWYIEDIAQSENRSLRQYRVVSLQFPAVAGRCAARYRARGSPAFPAGALRREAPGSWLSVGGCANGEAQSESASGITRGLVADAFFSPGAGGSGAQLHDQERRLRRSGRQNERGSVPSQRDCGYGLRVFQQ